MKAVRGVFPSMIRVWMRGVEEGGGREVDEVMAPEEVGTWRRDDTQPHNIPSTCDCWSSL